MRKSFIIILLLAISFSLVFSSLALAQQQENKVVTFLKNVVTWPFNVTKKGAETVGKTVERPIEGTAKTAACAVETVTGKPEKIKDVIVEPVKMTGETAAIAVEGTLKTPIEGTKETFEEEKK